MGRRGKKAKPGKREPNGKLSRRKVDKQARRTLDEQAEMHVARAARERVHGVNAEDSATDLAASVIGRLYLAKQLEPEQLNAARLLADTYAAYHRAIDAPRPPKAVNIGGVSAGEVPDVTPEQSRRARQNWDDIVSVLQGANQVFRHAAIYAACDYLVLRDLQLPHLVDDCKLGLTAIAKAYGMTDRRAA